ncbi:MAG: D-glycero-beta-D-manno-heptose 1,7-bisphosphate 7-phosphatase [Candidatus Omnitrophica bacterium]|nr:D-glycero-beta-D-manno-heptose 1,7-bisphosphate 7-phosphatase [Candidatus Omnitrophota bacterium]
MSEKIIFLDRDGVINYDGARGEYISSHEDFKFLPGSLQALKRLTDAGYKIIIISNQAGVAKGLYSKEDLDKITAKMTKGTQEIGAKIYSVNYCMHQDEDMCDCRKPKPGLIERAAKGLDVDFGNTFFIGDSRRDILAGKAVGLKTVFVMTGNTKLEDLDVKPDFIAKDLLGAVDKIVLK